MHAAINGKFIAFIGMPGVGKSTLTTLLAKLLNAQEFIEPGEEAWPLNPEKPWQDQAAKLEYWVRDSNLENFTQARKLANTGRTTWTNAPCPDILVLLETDIETWQRFVLARGRGIDEIDKFSPNYAEHQALFARSAEQFARDRGIPLIQFKNEFGSPDYSANKLAAELISN